MSTNNDIPRPCNMFGSFTGMIPKKCILSVFTIMMIVITYYYYIKIQHMTLDFNKYVTVPMEEHSGWTAEETAFPLAFSILAHTDVDRLKRLLASIYRPQNFYCIHIDLKTPPNYWIETLHFVKTLGSNVYLIPQRDSISVRWGRFSLLEAEFVCARKALESGYKWKYYINLTGQEFPLRTNWELVRVLRIMNGSNLIQGRPVWKRPWAVPPKHTYGNMSITWYEGSFHVALTYPFVQYMLHNPKAQLLLKSLKQLEQELDMNSCPDEQFFITLNNNPSEFQVPGAFLGGPKRIGLQPFLTRYKIWQGNKDKCLSKQFRHSICMLGSKDVVLLKNSTKLFANKFAVDVDPKGYDELEQWIEMKKQYETDNHKLHPSFPQSYYANLELRWNHL